MSRTTAILASLFFLTSLSLAYLAGKTDNKGHDIMDVPQAEPPAQRDLPPVSEEKPAPHPSDLPRAPEAPAAAPGK